MAIATKDYRAEALRLHGEKKSCRQIEKELGEMVDHTTIWRWIRDHRASKQSNQSIERQKKPSEQRISA